MRSRWLLALALLGGVALTAPARAGLIPAAVNVTPAGGNFRFTYTVVLPSDYKVKTGDFFTVYDFNGYAGGFNTQPAGWAFGAQLTGTNPPGIRPNDDPAVMNLTWTYAGPDIVGNVTLGHFSAVSQHGGSAEDDFASRDYSLLQGRVVGNITTTDVPAPIAATPEPTTLLLLTAAVPALGLWRALRTRRRR